MKTSAGILPYRVGPDGSIEVLLVHPGGPFWTNKDQHAWSVAKGEHGTDEDPLDAAEREFAEEVGTAAPAGARVDLGSVRQGSTKTVHVWAVLTEDLPLNGLASNEFDMEWPPHSGIIQSFPEVDRVEWMDLDQARARLVRAQGVFLDRLVDRVGGS